MNSSKVLFFGIFLMFNLQLCFSFQISNSTIKQSLTKEGRSNLNEPAYGQQIWNPPAGNRFEITSILPPILTIGFMLILVPILLSIFAPLVFNNPMNSPFNTPYNSFPNGRRRRDVTDQLNKTAKSFGLTDKDFDLSSLLSSSTSMLQGVAKNLGESLIKYGQK